MSQSQSLQKRVPDHTGSTALGPLMFGKLQAPPALWMTWDAMHYIKIWLTTERQLSYVCTAAAAEPAGLMHANKACADTSDCDKS